VLFLVWNGSISWWSYAGGYALPTLIGNALGGIALVAALNHAQVVAGTGQSGPK
jgi:formate/nitrite transporter FocA (FNT family)